MTKFIIFIHLIGAATALAQLPRAFNSAGALVTDIGGNNDVIRDRAIQSDGKVIVTGLSNNGSYNDFAVARYNTDGSLDTGFDTDGIATYSFAEGESRAHAITIDSSGRYLIAGTRWGYADFDFGISRLLTDGSPDLTFGNEGHVLVDFGANDFPHGIALDGNKVVVAGYSGDGATFDVALARLQSDGSLDTAFSSDGLVITDPDGVLSDWNSAHDVVVSGGRYVVTGKSRLLATSQERGIIARYLTNGNLDTTFGTAGITTTIIGAVDDLGWALTTDASGRFLVTGRTQSGDYELAVLRYRTNGTLDTTFSGDGIQTYDVAGRHDVGRGLAISPAGHIYAGGRTYNGTNWDFFAVKFLSDGSVDTRFNLTGVRQLGIGSGDDIGYTLAFNTSNSMLYIGGASYNGTDMDFALTRMSQSGTPGSGGILDPAFDTDGITTVNFSGGNDESYDFDINSNDYLTVFGRDGNTHVVTRYTTAGALDTTFSGDGIATIDIGGGVEVSNAGLLQSDQKAIGVGVTGRDFAIYRLNTDGSLDTTFSTDGQHTYSFGASNQNDTAYGVALATSNKIVVVGRADDDNWAVSRLTSAGVLDTTFSGDGILEEDFGGTSDIAYSVAVQSDNKIIVAGTSGTDFAVARYHTDGSLDTAFSSDGLATYDLAGGTDVARSIIIDTNGKYVLAGTAGSDFGMIRIETSGALDTSFSGDGIFTIDFNTTTETGYDVTLQTDGKFVVVGQTVLDFGIVRVQPSGVLDTDFAYGGKLSIDIGGGTTDEARAVKIDSQQRIVVIGIGGSVDFAAIRLLP